MDAIGNPFTALLDYTVSWHLLGSTGCPGLRLGIEPLSQGCQEKTFLESRKYQWQHAAF